MALPIVDIGTGAEGGIGKTLWVKPPGAEVGVMFIPTVPEMAAKAVIGDYAVIYRDGYQSVSPKTEFEEGYYLLASP